MITTTSENSPYQVRFSNGTHWGVSDTTPDKGGGSSGFRPHELLEAALGSCLNMHVRMYADNHGISIGKVTTKVTLDRSNPDKAIFSCSIGFSEDLSRDQVAKLMQVSAACPVHNTLSREIVIRESAE